MLKRLSNIPSHYRRLILILILVGLVDAVGYSLVRGQHLLVHRAAYVNGKTDSHRIDVGDLGPGFNPSYRIAQLSYWVFTPMRWIESGYWSVRYPAGSSWPY